MFELEKQIERLKELRQLARQIQAEAEQIRSTLSKIVESAGGKLVVGSYVLSLSDVTTVPYAKVLSALKESHPELSAEIDELVKEFQTVTHRLDIAERQNEKQN